ncbi:MAG: polysaccharide biosynthesis/export family protein [Acidobacteria bacterium]|nr:polysaccharide biosynthesis/export family protein [Acidobacteriota bacterium]
MRKFLLLLSLALILSTVSLAQSSTSTSSSSTANAVLAENRVTEAKAVTKANENSYRIGIGDLLDVRVLNHPEMSRKTRVEGTGIIRMPYVGEVPATCLTETQLSQIITDRYRKYIREPNVDVFIEEYSSQPVAVIGAVDKPGRFQLQRRVRLIELLTYAGGPKQGMAGPTLHLIRSGEKDMCATAAAASSTPEQSTTEQATAVPQLISFKLKDLLTGSAEANLYVQPGDIISLPEAEQIFVTGYVMRPGPLPLNGNVTLTQAIGMVGGYTPEASKKKVRLIRQAPNSNARIEQLFNIEDIEKRKMDDVVLQANDLIEVPNSAGKVIFRGLLNAGPTGFMNALPTRIIR